MPGQHLTQPEALTQVHAWSEGDLENINAPTAQTIASWFASPGTYGQEFATLSTTGTCTEHLPVSIRHEAALQKPGTPEHEALEALAEYADQYVPLIFGCTTSFGHRFMGSGDEPLEEDCLHCGGRWAMRRRRDNPAMVDYITATGRDPIDCDRLTAAPRLPGAPRTRLTHLFHGPEAICEARNGAPCTPYEDKGSCQHLAARRCNCLACKPA